MAQLWQFPNTHGILDVADALEILKDMGLKPRQILGIINRNHIFTHIVWKMRGIYLEVREKSDRFIWFSTEQIRAEAALPTAYRQFWEAIDADHI